MLYRHQGGITNIGIKVESQTLASRHSSWLFSKKCTAIMFRICDFNKLKMLTRCDSYKIELLDNRHTCLLEGRMLERPNICYIFEKSMAFKPRGYLISHSEQEIANYG